MENPESPSTLTTSSTNPSSCLDHNAQPFSISLQASLEQLERLFSDSIDGLLPSFEQQQFDLNMMNQLQNIEESKNTEEEEGDEEGNDISEVLDALMQMHQNEEQTESSFEQHSETITNAIDLNERLQRQVLKQIELVDQQTAINEDMLRQAKLAANAENRFQSRLYIHCTYKAPINYFSEDELIKTKDDSSSSKQISLTVNETEEGQEVEEQEDDSDDESGDEAADLGSRTPYKAWSPSERKRLMSAIQFEAKRILALDFVKKDEVWRVWEIDKATQKELELLPVTRFDWDRISSLYVHTRTPTQCLMQWTTQEHPQINKTPWSVSESKKLSTLVNQLGMDGNWEEIANRLGTDRTISQCFSHYMAAKNKSRAKSLTWSAEEDKKLSDALKLFGSCNWQQIASILKGRTGQQCLHRWTRASNPALVKTRWTPEEDTLLKRAVELYGPGKWKSIKRMIPGRMDSQCRERWMNVLEPSLDTTPLNEEELEKLIALVQEHGEKWSALAKYMPGRTDNFLMRQYRAYKTKDEREKLKRTKKVTKKDETAKKKRKLKR